MECNQIKMTKHAIQRKAQRGFGAVDEEIILRIGTQTEDGIIVTEKNAKDACNWIMKLKGTRIVLEGSKIITIYRAQPSTEKLLLRAARERNLD